MKFIFERPKNLRSATLLLRELIKLTKDIIYSKDEYKTVPDIRNAYKLLILVKIFILIFVLRLAPRVGLELIYAVYSLRTLITLLLSLYRISLIPQVPYQYLLL